MSKNQYTNEEMLACILEAARQCYFRAGELRQTDLRREMQKPEYLISSEYPAYQLGFTINDLRRHVALGEPLTARRGAPKSSIADITTISHASEDSDPEEVWSSLKNHSEKTIMEEVKQRFRRKDLSHIDGPIGVIYMGDMHIGHQAVDYSRIDWCIEQIERSDIPVYLVQVGDATDNLFWVVSEIAKQVEGIPAQAVGASRVFNRALEKDRLIAVVPGNHDQFGQNRSGMCIWDLVVGRCPGLVWDPSELVMDLVVGDVTYTEVFRHKVQGRSQYRAEHGVDRWHIFTDTHHDADLVAAGHIHTSGYSQRHMKGKIRHGLQLGSYKAVEGVGDEHAVTQGFAWGNRSPDMFGIHYHDRRELSIYENTQEGLEKLESLWASRRRTNQAAKKATKRKASKKKSSKK